MRPCVCKIHLNCPENGLFFALPAEPDDVNVRLKRAVALASRRVNVGGDFSKSTTSPCQCQMLENRRLLSVDLFSDTNPNPNTGTTSNAFVFDCNGSLYFNADDGTHGVELYKGNGTQAGTSMLKDINPTGSSLPASFCNVNGTFYFTANDGTHGIQLWKTDGTSDGTTMVKIINPTGTFQGQPISLFNFNGTLYFSADDGTHGRELWTSDGTDGGTQLVDIRPGGTTSSSNPTGFIVFNNKLYFSAQDGTHGIELWTSDGTPGGTLQVCDVYNGNNQFGTTNITLYNGNLYFNASNNTDFFELWKSDGVQGDPAIEVKNINPKPNASSNPTNLTVFNGLLYFVADDGTNGTELWVTDGTDANTQMVKDINTTVGTPPSSSPTGLFVFNNALYFDADSGLTGPELYKSDGTTAGTAKLKDVNPSISGSGFSVPTIFNNALYFISTNGSNGLELFRTDGTTNGTVMVRDINPGSAGAFTANNISMRAFNGALYFYANDNVHGNELWKLSPQAATGNGFNVNTPAVTVTFNDPATVNNTAATYTIQNLPDGGTFSPLGVSYDAPSRTATFSLPTNLADGQYRLTLPATAATDAYGNWMASTYTADFFILGGDANHNGVVDTADFTALAQHFNSATATYVQGDFNRDGMVNVLDFNVLATKFGSLVPGPVMTAGSLFSEIELKPENQLISILD